jgi:hypothetical protein
MVEEMYAHLSFFVEMENLPNLKRTQFGPIYSGTIAAPMFGNCS